MGKQEREEMKQKDLDPITHLPRYEKKQKTKKGKVKYTPHHLMNRCFIVCMSNIQINDNALHLILIINP